MILDGRVPGGPLADKWESHKFAMKLVNPANRRKPRARTRICWISLFRYSAKAFVGPRTVRGVAVVSSSGGRCRR